jgi:hypothetical protein
MGEKKKKKLQVNNWKLNICSPMTSLIDDDRMEAKLEHTKSKFNCMQIEFSL